jgi:hypothetical protein
MLLKALGHPLGIAERKPLGDAQRQFIKDVGKPLGNAQITP